MHVLAALNPLWVIGAFSLGDQPLGQKPIGTITEDDFELFMKHLGAQGRAASETTPCIGYLATTIRRSMTRPW